MIKPSECEKLTPAERDVADALEAHLDAKLHREYFHGARISVALLLLGDTERIRRAMVERYSAHWNVVYQEDPRDGSFYWFSAK